MESSITKISVKSCVVKGKRCIALDKHNNKWAYTALSDAEADMMAEAVDKRGYVWTEYWDKQ